MNKRREIERLSIELANEASRRSIAESRLAAAIEARDCDAIADTYLPAVLRSAWAELDATREERDALLRKVDELRTDRDDAYATWEVA